MRFPVFPVTECDVLMLENLNDDCRWKKQTKQNSTINNNDNNDNDNDNDNNDNDNE